MTKKNNLAEIISIILGPNGQTELAELMDVNPRTVRSWIEERIPISDERLDQMESIFRDEANKRGERLKKLAFELKLSGMKVALDRKLWKDIP